MSKLSKGQLSRKKIINDAREVFNRKGSQITIQELALELGEGVSYITNHYRTKDHLIVAIAGEYEEKYYEILAKNGYDLSTMEKVARFVSAVMDLQYRLPLCHTGRCCQQQQSESAVQTDSGELP